MLQSLDLGSPRTRASCCVCHGVEVGLPGKGGLGVLPSGLQRGQMPAILLSEPGLWQAPSLPQTMRPPQPTSSDASTRSNFCLNAAGKTARLYIVFSTKTPPDFQRDPVPIKTQPDKRAIWEQICNSIPQECFRCLDSVPLCCSWVPPPERRQDSQGPEAEHKGCRKRRGMRLAPRRSQELLSITTN